MDTAALLQAALARDKRSLARLISLAEEGDPAFAGVAGALEGRLGRAVRVGFTGPPGAGKSTLVEAYGRLRRERGERVAVICVDPTSPFTGGALLGDRVRMRVLGNDPECFVRSMATRGAFGGLARAADEVADLLDAAGYDRILLETVGVGQSEVDVARAADVTVVVLVPGAGDSIQAMKAGLMEIADVFVINKADRPGADLVEREIEEALSLGPKGRPRPPIVRTVAREGVGVEEVDRAVEGVLERLRSESALERRRFERRVRRTVRLVEEALHEDFGRGRGLAARAEELLQAEPALSPREAARRILEEAGLRGAGGSEEG